MSRKYRCYRHPKTRNEKKQNQDGWCRAKRRPAHLADAWDDSAICHQRSWKKSRKKQYHENGRGKKHITYINDDSPILKYRLERHFERIGIPYRIEQVKTVYYVSHYGNRPLSKEMKRSKIIWHKIIWWSNKNIGIEKVLEELEIWK